MEGIFAVVALEEIPIQQRRGIGRHALMKRQQLRGRIGQMFQHIKADHRVETHCTGGLQIPMHRELVGQAKSGRPLLDKSLVVRVQIDEPDVIHLG